MRVSRLIRSALGTVARNTLFPVGSVHQVLWGPCRGMRYRIFSGYGHAYLFGGWERKAMALMMRYVKPESVAYDLGANYGMHTLLLARLVGPSGRVYAFEPNPEIRAALEEHLALNSLTMVQVIPKAVCDQAGTAVFDSGGSATGHLVTATAVATGTTYEVHTISLDEFVLQQQNAPPGFIKIDIEGAESAALRGASEVIARYRPVLLIELHNPVEDRAVGAFLKRLGYGAVRMENGKPVENMESGWPDRTGMWGTVLALPSVS
jgi:FkbM family methyltransferase